MQRRLLQPQLTVIEECQKNKQIMPSISIPIESTEERGGQMPNNNGDVGDSQVRRRGGTSQMPTFSTHSQFRRQL
jgi:hypothetical protein